MGAEMSEFEYNRAMNSTNEVEKKRWLEDKEQYGDEQEGEYKGIKWRMRRPHKTFWCGYVEYDGHVSDKCMESLENIAHGGLTAHLGFDCYHAGDFPCEVMGMGVYRDYHYVRDTLHAMIDCILSE